MALFDVDVIVGFLDSAERTAEVTYRLRQQFDDTANAGAGNMVTVMDTADDLITNLDVLTWDHIDYYYVRVIRQGAGAAANAAANNQVRAFTRVTLANGEQSSFEVPAWDDLLYDQDSNNLLSAAYNTAAQAVADLLKDPEENSNMSTVNWSQSRTRKSRNVLS